MASGCHGDSRAGGSGGGEVLEEAVGDVRVQCPAGRIDHTSVEAFQNALLPRLEDCREDGVAIVLDLSAVEYMSSVGLRVLMLAAKQCKGQSGRIAVAALGEQMREIFQISRFDMVFPVYEDRAAAIAALTRQE
jgi:anti-sigma B factor antagonist/stage II sporulation protein AA (anti-sigma F factor antagonist)